MRQSQSQSRIGLLCDPSFDAYVAVAARDGGTTRSRHFYFDFLG
jgi:hypothetical protein